jgi:hypothetical protein
VLGGQVRGHCTFAVTDAAALIATVQLFVLLPPLEHAPDQMASRPLVTVSVTLVPDVNEAEPLLPTATLMPAGVDVMRSPLRPVAVTVSATVCDGGGAAVTVRPAVRVVPL